MSTSPFPTVSLPLPVAGTSYSTVDNLRLQTLLRKAGLRPTIHRLYVLRVLDGGAPRAFTADQVFQQLSELDIAVSQATVYSALNELEQHKLLVRTRLQDASDRKIRYMTSGAPSVAPCMFTCRVCGKQAVVADPAFSDQLQRQARVCGFDGQPETVHIESICSGCA